MFASFHSKGKIPSCSDMLNTCASGVLICSTDSFSPSRQVVFGAGVAFGTDIHDIVSQPLYTTPSASCTPAPPNTHL